MSGKMLFPVIALIVVIGAAIFVVYNVDFDSDIETPMLQVLSIIQIDSVSVVNAEYQLSVHVSNTGSGSGNINRVYVNGDEVDGYGYEDGGILTDDSFCVTSVPVDGLRVAAGKSVDVFVWVGENATRGSLITININSPDSMATMRTIEVN